MYLSLFAADSGNQRSVTLDDGIVQKPRHMCEDKAKLSLCLTD
jgi:hypothetical protein